MRMVFLNKCGDFNLIEKMFNELMLYVYIVF